MQRLEFSSMGSRIVAVVDSEARPEALDRLPAQFETWEQVLSRFRNDSELCELNRRAGSTVEVSQVLWDVFEAARHADRLTGGLVNPLIMEALARVGYDRSFEKLDVSSTALDPALAPAIVPPLQSIVANPAQHALGLPAGAQLDFGGVAKGWAAHQAMLALMNCGPALVSAGGDIAISGPRPDGGGWEIAVDDPLSPGDYLGTVVVEKGGIATSGRDYRRWSRGGVLQHHIIDPYTARPAETDVLTATVIAPDAMRAEALAKALLIAGSEAALQWLDADDDLAGLLVLEDGRQLQSRNLYRYLY